MRKHIKKIKAKVKKHAKETYYYLVYRTMYVAGLTFLIPMVFAFAFHSGGDLKVPLGYLMFSLFLIMFAFFGLLRRKRHRGETLKSFGRMTLIPGTIAFILLILGNEVVVRLFSVLPGFGSFEIWLSFYLHYFIPKISAIIISYIVIGSALYFAGSRIKK